MNTNEARLARPFGKVLNRDGKGRPVTVLVPGHEGRQYEVIVHRGVHAGHAAMLPECSLVTALGPVPCPAASHGLLCYHAMAALILCASDQRMQVRFCKSFSHAQRASRFNRARTLLVKAYRGKSILWLAVER